VQLKKVFGIYRNPVNVNLNFVTDNVCIFLISNYLAVQDIESGETEYVELSQRVDNPTAMFSTRCKEDTAPSK